MFRISRDARAKDRHGMALISKLREGEREREISCRDVLSKKARIMNPLIRREKASPSTTRKSTSRDKNHASSLSMGPTRGESERKPTEHMCAA